MVDRERRNAALFGDGIAFTVCALAAGVAFGLYAREDEPVALGVAVVTTLLALVTIGRWWYDLHR
jgi:hypothetical protein